MGKVWRIFKAHVPDLGAMLRPFDDEMDRYLKLANRKFDLTVETFSHKPAFTLTNKRTGVSLAYMVIGEIYTRDKVYGYLNNGTGVRYATMSPGFVAKTSPGRLRAGAGKGGVAYVSRKRPRPGIKARNFEGLVVDETERDFQSGFKRAVRKAVKISRHAI